MSRRGRTANEVDFLVAGSRGIGWARQRGFNALDWLRGRTASLTLSDPSGTAPSGFRGITLSLEVVPLWSAPLEMDGLGWKD